MEILIRPENRKLKIEGITNIKDLLKKLNLREEEVLIIDLEGDRLLTIDDKLKLDQKIEVRKVISGG